MDKMEYQKVTVVGVWESSFPVIANIQFPTRKGVSLVVYQSFGI